MAKREAGSHPATFLGDELKRARITARFTTHDALAAKMGYDRTLITKIESGERLPTVDVLTAWCKACGLPGIPPEWVVGLARRSDGAIPSWFEAWIEAEGKAHTLRMWAPLLLPGLVQPAEYARALFLAMGMDQEAAEEQVAIRLGRQEILDRPDPPQLVVVLYEAVLDHLIGSPQIMHDALIHLAELSQRPNVGIQVVPVDAGANAGLGGAFSLASGDGGSEVLAMETVEDVTTESRSLVRKAANIFVRVQADALPRAASRAVILEKAERWNAR
jgi:transcriptional regulator with XRE-family HTH domain